jgi:hypothetical protein
VPIKQELAMHFFVWYDDTPKKPTGDKLQEAIVAYVARFQLAPRLVLVNVADKLEMVNVVVRCERMVQPNTFWLGYEEQGDPPLATDGAI